MKTSNIYDIFSDFYSIITVGSFDGFHLAHKSIFNFMKQKAIELNYKSIIYTFENHPNSYFSNNNFKLISTKAEKNFLIDKSGIDFVFFEKFDENLAKLSAVDFVNILIKKFNMKAIVVGDDNKIGNNREGDYQYLLNLSKKMNFQVFKVNSFYVDNLRVSSSEIRKNLLSGNIEKANKLLGYEFFIYSEVEKGSNIGKKIGFPTANLKIPDEKLLPSNGVYAVKVKIEDKFYLGMCNIGNRPTINFSEKPTVEVNIFNFDDNLYSKQIKVLFLKKIRDEIVFDSKENLIEQIGKDKVLIENEFKTKVLIN